jgi:hypothetical protein
MRSEVIGCLNEHYENKFVVDAVHQEWTYEDVRHIWRVEDRMMLHWYRLESDLAMWHNKEQ